MAELELLSRSKIVPMPRLGAGAYLRRHVATVALPFVAMADALLIGLAFLGCYYARFEWGLISPAPAPPLGPYLHASGLVAVVWTGCMAAVGLYGAKRALSRFDDAVLTATGLALGATLTLALSFFYRSFSYSRLVYAYAFALSLGVLLVWHLGLRALQALAMKRGWGVHSTLVLGANPLADLVVARLVARPRLGYQVVGQIALSDERGEAAHAPVLGTMSDLEGLLDAHAIDSVIVCAPSATGEALDSLIRRVGATRPVAVQIAPGVVETMTAHLEVSSLDGLPMLAIREVSLRKWHNRAIKRVMDMGLAAVALFAAAPAMAAVAIAIRLTSPGPVFYAQERLGRDGRRFTIYKFRSMSLTAEPDGPVWTRRDDDRATPLGAMLRRYSLDELPQLWNVLRGDMSLVGPRPERPFFVDQFSATVPKYMDRHLVRSGLTGWAQINGLRGDVSIEERTRYDIFYVENWSVLLDLRILLETAGAIFRRPGY